MIRFLSHPANTGFLLRDDVEISLREERGEISSKNRRSPTLMAPLLLEGHPLPSAQRLRIANFPSAQWLGGHREQRRTVSV